MTHLHVLVSDGIDDPLQPSGANRYDRAVLRALAANGWTVYEHLIPGVWQEDMRVAVAGVEAELESVPEQALMVVDGVVGRLAAVRLAARARQSPVALLTHSPFPDMDPLLGVAAAVFVTSNWTRDQFVGAGVSARRLHVAVPGVEAAPLATGSVDGASLVTVGPVTFDKGYDILLDALRMLDDLDWRATWVGPLDRDANFVAELRSRIDGSWLADRIELRGPVADPGEVYAQADLLVHPTMVESYGMVVTEALARGLPVVASAVGGVPEALGSVGRGQLPGQLVPNGDSRALSSALRRWLAESWWQARLRAAARDRRSELPTWDDTAATIAAALRPLAGETVK